MKSFIVALVALLGAAANLIWGSDSTISVVASVIIGAVPSAIYIVETFITKIKLADANNDGKITITELSAAIRWAFEDCGGDIQAVTEAIDNVVTIADEATRIAAENKT